MDNSKEKVIGITGKSARNGFVVASVILVIISVYKVLRKGEIPFEFIVLGSSQAAYWLSQIYYRMK